MSVSDLTKTHLPTVAVVTLITMIGGIIWSWAVLTTRVELQGEQLKNLALQIKDMPSRREFEGLNTKVDEISKNIQEIIKLISRI